MTVVEELELAVVSPKEAAEIIKAIIKTDERELPILFHGPPGIGKSDIIKQAAEELGIEYKVSIPATTSLIDLRIPDIKKEDGERVAYFTRPSKEILPKDGRGIMFYDEIGNADNEILSAYLQIILNRRLGDARLGDGWFIFAATNLPSDAAIANAIPTSIADRFIHLLLRPTVEDWVTWASVEGIDNRIIAFINSPIGKEHLHDFDPNRARLAFSTPRGWYKVHKILQLPISEDKKFKMIAGRVGAKAATAFKNFLDNFTDIPNHVDILSGKIKNFSELGREDDPDFAYVVISTVASGYADVVRKNLIPARKAIDNAYKFIMTMPREFAVPCGISLHHVHKKLLERGLVNFTLDGNVEGYRIFSDEYYDMFINAADSR